MIQPGLVTIPVHSNQPKYNYPVTVLMHSNRVIVCSFACRNVHSARSACKTMNKKQKQGEENCLEWRRFRSRYWWLTVALVSRQPAVVADVSRPSSFLCFGVLSSSAVLFSFPLLTVFLSLCSDFVAVRLVLAMPLVAAKRRTGRGTQRTLLRFFSVFSSSSSCLLLVFLLFVHSTLSLSLLAFLSFPFCSSLFPLSLFLF